MPSFFQYSKNGRRDKTTNKKKKRQWAKSNNSTMNRICKAFDDIGNINMNMASIPPFNWQMLLSNPCLSNRMDIVSEFRALDKTKVSIVMAHEEESPAEKEIIDNNTIYDEYITEELESKFGSLEECYPYIAKFLFADEQVSNASHKQSFWRIFGNIALRNLENNLQNYTVCPICGAKVPAWATSHSCPKDSQGFYECIDCGKRCERTNSKQKRCSECQKDYKVEYKRIKRRQTAEEKEERGKKFTTFLQSRCRKTS